jgi:hypothetical protein
VARSVVGLVPLSFFDDLIIVGTAADSTQSLSNVPTYAFIWTSTTGIQRLPGLEGGAALAEETSAVVAINHVHQVLGTIVTAGGLQRTVVWTLPGAPTSTSAVLPREPAAP